MVFIIKKPNFFPGFYEKAMIQTTLTFISRSLMVQAVTMLQAKVYYVFMIDLLRAKVT